MGYYPEPYDEILKLFPTEKDVYDLIYNAKTTYCKSCGGFRKQSRSVDYRYVHCQDCDGQTLILEKTIFANAHLDLRIWVYIIYATLYTRHPTSGRWLMRTLNINSYNTIWKIRQKVQSAAQVKDIYNDNAKILDRLKSSLKHLQ